MEDERLFCVYTFSGAPGDYRPVGVFTKQEDAKAFAAERETEEKHFPIVRRSFNELIESEIKVRLGRMADILFPKEQAELDARQDRATETGEAIDFAIRTTDKDKAYLAHHSSPMPADISVRS